MAQELACRRCIVSGQVQGVFFRASAARRARELGVSGHALNLADGTVEVLAIGPQAAVEALSDWLAIGPPAARVSSVEIRDQPPPESPPERFTTG